VATLKPRFAGVTGTRGDIALPLYEASAINYVLVAFLVQTFNGPDSSLLKAFKVRDDGLLPDITLGGAEFAGFQGLEHSPQNLLSHAALRRIELF
jgi:hypothetical protein